LYSANSNLPITPFIYKVGYDSKDHLKNTTVSRTTTSAAAFVLEDKMKTVHETTVSNKSFSLTTLSPAVKLAKTSSQTAISATPRIMSTTNAEASQKANSLDSKTPSQISSSETVGTKIVSAVRLAIGDYQSEQKSQFDGRFTHNLLPLFSVIFVLGFFKCKNLLRHFHTFTILI
jgi:hypothetical protein